MLRADESEPIVETVKLLPPEKIKENLDKFVIGQDDAKRVLSVAVYNHYKRVNHNLSLKNKKNKHGKRGSESEDGIELQKSNVLLLGPSGCGKTLLAQTLSKMLNVPFAMADATTLTEAGYVGEDVENILLRLIKDADYNIELAERGIIYIDEVDKIARKNENMSITRDVSGEGVQQALLKILESTVSSVPPQGGRKHPQQECLTIDTTNVLFILGGAFVGLDDIISKRVGKSGIGFEKNVEDSEHKHQELLPLVQPQDLIKFGMIPELIGRVPVNVTISELKVDDLVRVLVEPQNSIVRQYTELMKMDNVELVFEQEALRAIAQKAIDLSTGARGLRTITEGLMLDIMYKVPSDPTIRKVIITERTVNGGEPMIEKEAA